MILVLRRSELQLQHSSLRNQRLQPVKLQCLKSLFNRPTLSTSTRSGKSSSLYYYTPVLPPLWWHPLDATSIPFQKAYRSENINVLPLKVGDGIGSSA